MPMKTFNLEVEHFIFFLDQPHHLSLLFFSPFTLVEDWEKLQGIFIDPGQLSLSQSKDPSFYSLFFNPSQELEVYNLL